MKPILIVPSKNGYVVMEYSGEIPQADLMTISVANKLTRSSWGSSAVIDILEAHFEPPKAEKEAA